MARPKRDHLDTERNPDERVKLPLDPEDALRALLAVDPDEAPESVYDDAGDGA